MCQSRSFHPGFEHGLDFCGAEAVGMHAPMSRWSGLRSNILRAVTRLVACLRHPRTRLVFLLVLLSRLFTSRSNRCLFLHELLIFDHVFLLFIIYFSVRTVIYFSSNSILTFVFSVFSDWFLIDLLTAFYLGGSAPSAISSRPIV